MRVAVIGAGPAGFFAAGALLKAKNVFATVDIFDRLPAPFGLVRYGVAPDHQKIKKVRAVFEKIASDERVRFFGHVNFGTDLRREDVCAHYDQVIYSVGAPSDRRLGISGEDLSGSFSATEFVAWYNGHPDHATQTFPLNVKSAVVIGAGNVALDVARVLAKSVEELSTSDIANHSLDALKHSQIEDIYILARRGPAQAKFTNPELKEFGTLAVCAPVVSAADCALDPDSAASLEKNKTNRRNVELLKGFVGVDPQDKPRRVHFRFLTSPLELVGDAEGNVVGVEIVRNELRATESGYLQSYPTEDVERIDAGLVLRSVGYRGVCLPDVPFDERRAVIPNEAGRVIDPKTQRPLVGEYAAGWIKRGPSGIIGTNKPDAHETVAAMLEDLPTTPAVDDAHADLAAIPALLAERGVRYVTFEEWTKINDAELAAGKESGQPRVKFTTYDSLIGAIDAS